MTADDDPFSDLDEWDVLDDLERAEQELTIRMETRRYGKPVTIVEGFDRSKRELKSVASTLKRRLGTGGTTEEGAIELQGDHRGRVPELLRELGYEVVE